MNSRPRDEICWGCEDDEVISTVLEFQQARCATEFFSCRLVVMYSVDGIERYRHVQELVATDEIEY